MKSVKLNQLLSTPSPCLSLYVRDALGWEALEARLKERIAPHSDLALAYVRARPGIQAILRRQSHASHGFFLSSALAGHIALGYATDDHFTVAESYQLRPLLEDLFADPDYALVVLAESEMRLYGGNGRQMELLEIQEYAARPTRQRVYGAAGVLAAQRHVTVLKQMALRLAQSPRLANLPVVVAGDPQLTGTFLRHFQHPFGVVRVGGGPWESMTCPELTQAGHAFRPQLVEVYAQQFRLRLKNLMRGGRLLSDMASLIRAVGEGNVSRLLLPEKKHLWGELDLATGQHDVTGIAEGTGARDILATLAGQVVQDGGQIQFLPAHFFPHGSHAMAILREAPHAAFANLRKGG